MALNALPTAADKRRAVRSMFDRIAPRYDRMNRLLSAGLDQRWRRAALDALALGPGDCVIDLACGTGDLAQMARTRGARVLGVDFAGEMLRVARRRAPDGVLIQADAAALPFADACATAVTCGFALRNFVSLPNILSEVARVLTPGGRLVLIEVDRPRGRWMRAGHSLYFDRLVPLVGGLLSDRAAYAYLPQSTFYLPAEGELHKLLDQAGLEGFERRSRLLGAVQIVTATRGAWT
ncbi:MAG: ubiquinone/menaquinone biosynthesis methyltransferase [Myxococcota bacterium]